MRYVGNVLGEFEWTEWVIWSEVIDRSIGYWKEDQVDVTRSGRIENCAKSSFFQLYDGDKSTSI